MTRMVAVATALLVAIAASPLARAQSGAAAYLLKQEITDGCESGKGTIGPSGAIERDLDGDGLLDLIIAHDAIQCSGQATRSRNCGMQVCSVIFYLKRGRLLRKAGDMLGSNVQVASGTVPRIYMFAHGGRRGSVRWNGRSFD